MPCRFPVKLEGSRVFYEIVGRSFDRDHEWIIIVIGCYKVCPSWLSRFSQGGHFFAFGGRSS
jgi:hypothetical protein